jgi:multisubunit Na+/H+ antiporter MnhF subunit
MTFAFDQGSFIDLPLALALLALPGTLAMALFLERWL